MMEYQLKAFDTVSWEFLFNTLKRYNFGPEFIKWVKICYTDISSCVINQKCSSSYFQVSRGLRQGDPMSSFLFILVAEVMLEAIRKNPNIKGLIYNNVETKVSSYADDTTTLLQSVNDAKELF